MAKLLRNHIGLDGFIWAIGVVEDRNDPLFLGRCKVRYFGWHTEDKKDIPTKELPWSYPLLSLDNGRNSVGPKEGDWVVSFFRDGIIAQEPVMMGIVPGIPEEEANPKLGFNDPRPDSLLKGHKVARDPVSFPVQFDDGSGSERDELKKKSRYPQNEPDDGNLRYVDNKEATTNRFERAEHIKETIVESKRENVGIGQTNVPTASHPSSSVNTDVASLGIAWSEPKTPYGAKYPYNHSYFSESGHLVELDDTPGKERVHMYHRAGTFKEIHPDGSTVDKIVNDEYHITLKNRFTHIENSDYETVDKAKKLLVNKDKGANNYDITVDEGGNFNLTLNRGNWNILVASGDINACIIGNVSVRISGSLSFEVGGSVNWAVTGQWNQSVLGSYNSYVVGNMGETVVGTKTDMVAGARTEFTAGVTDITTVGDVRENIGGNRREKVDSDKEVKVLGKYTTHAKGNIYFQTLKSTTFQARKKIHMAAKIYTGSFIRYHLGLHRLQIAAFTVKLKSGVTNFIHAFYKDIVTVAYEKDHPEAPVPNLDDPKREKPAKLNFIKKPPGL